MEFEIENERMLRADEVAERLGVSRTTLYKMVEEGSFPRARKIHTKARGWPLSVVIKWIQETEESDPSDCFAPNRKAEG